MFHGSLVALVTPMRADGSIDEDAYARLIEWQIAEGTNGIVPVGTTGKSPTLSHEEHKRVVELAVAVAAKRVPVMAGAGSNSTTEAIGLAQHAKKAGADGVLVVTPYYNKPTQEGLYRHFTAIADAADIPLVIYNIPGRSVIDMSVETMARLSGHKNIVGVKDATANLTRPLHTTRACGAGFIQLSGEDHTVIAYLASGGHGCISVTANIAPKLCAQMHAAWKAGDVRLAMEIQDRLVPLHDAMFAESNPGPVKYAASLLGFGTATCRLPLAPIAEANAGKMRAAMLELGLLKGLMAAEAPSKSKSGYISHGIAAQNRKARFDYKILSTVEAGIVLKGVEVKSLRLGRATLSEAWAGERDGELYLFNAYIPEYQGGVLSRFDVRGARKLLVKKKERGVLIGAMARDGHTVVPLDIHFNPRGLAKVTLGVAEGRQKHDKRQAIAARDWQRDKARLLKNR